MSNPNNPKQAVDRRPVVWKRTGQELQNACEYRGQRKVLGLWKGGEIGPSCTQTPAFLALDVLENSWPNAFDVAAEWLDASTGDFVAQSTTLAKQQKQKASVWQQTALQPVLNCTDSKVSVSYCLFLSVSALKEQKWTKVNKRIKVVTSFLLNISESIRSLTKLGTNRPGSRLQPRFCSLQDLTVTVRIWALQRSVHICIWRITYRLLNDYYSTSLCTCHISTA